MLDVHPPHSATHTWKDFFIHIATIVVGLFIAVGLEQIVEHIHQQYELRELRESLDRERDANRKDIAKNIRDWRWEIVELQNDLMVLHFIREHPGVAQGDVPGDLFFVQTPVLVETSVWDTAQQKGTVNLMSVDEAERYAGKYRFLKGLAQGGQDAYAAFNDAGSFDVDDGNPTHATPAALDSRIRLVQLAIQRLITVGYSLAYMHNSFPDLGSYLTYNECDRAHHYPFHDSPNELARAHRLTLDRLSAAGMERGMIDEIPTAPAK